MTDKSTPAPGEFFRELGNLVETRWREKNYDDAVFPQIAAEALAEHSPYGQVDAWDIIRDLAANRPLPAQMDPDAGFGNPPITLFSAPRFFIDIYYWLDGTTAVHQHSFAGAFQVLLGSSIHSQYTFAQQQRINPQMALGKLNLLEVSLLEAGAIKQIIPGQDYIHALFHLDRPSATITVRTYQIPHFQPQWSYLKPSVAFDPFFKEPGMMKKLQSVSLLLGMRHPETDAILSQMIGSSDFQTAFLVLDTVHQYLDNNELEQAFGVTSSTDRFDRLLLQMRERHGELVNSLPPVFAEQRRQIDLVIRRRLITDPEHRFFLALLLNVSGRERILDLVRQRFPEEPPIEKIMMWVEDLSAIRQMGSKEPSVLGIEDFGDLELMLLELLLEGHPPREAIAELSKAPDQTQRDELEAKASAAVAKLRRAKIFSALFDEP